MILSDIYVGNQKPNISALENEEKYLSWGVTFYSESCWPCTDTEQAVLQRSGQF